MPSPRQEYSTGIDPLFVNAALVNANGVFDAASAGTGAVATAMAMSANATTVRLTVQLPPVPR